MPNWGDVLEEIRKSPARENQSPFDVVRRKYLRKLSEKTGSCVIAYYSGFLSHRGGQVAINDADKNGFMLCCHEIDRAKGLDLILHTPGGSLYAAVSLIDYLKKMFGRDIRAIVPQIAMSAGTLMAMSCKSIVMGKHSDLGPVDPQVRGYPAFVIKNQFERAYKEIKADPRTAPIWQPVIAQIGLALVRECDLAIEAAKSFVEKYLKENMLRDDPEVESIIPKIVEEMSDLNRNKSHEKRFSYEDCVGMGLKVEKIEDDAVFQDLLLTVHHSFMHVLDNAHVVKIIENHRGHAYIKQQAQRQPAEMAVGLPR